MDAAVESDIVWRNITAALGVYSNVKWIQVITSMLSIVGSGSIIGYAVFQNAVKLPEVRPLFYLSVSDLLVAFCWLLGAVLYKPHTQSVPCFNLQAVGQVFYLSTYLYTINYMWQTFSNFRRRISNDLNQISDKECCIGRVATVLCSSCFIHLPCIILWEHQGMLQEQQLQLFGAEHRIPDYNGPRRFWQLCSLTHLQHRCLYDYILPFNHRNISHIGLHLSVIQNDTKRLKITTRPLGCHQCYKTYLSTVSLYLSFLLLTSCYTDLS
ncbi:transmembrane protein 116 isoform X2 [Bufo gargarizans]|uniref:transmembrane protein 116 isoform X2 n=1 Tax=Bufo gargarizans TaxID=30331 RepID=UPI001CF3E1C3|nr:transmembrane protein 116 isoform X2 [Bufo gargarizans]